jgi:hypothetical protein
MKGGAFLTVSTIPQVAPTTHRNVKQIHIFVAVVNATTPRRLHSDEPRAKPPRM